MLTAAALPNDHVTLAMIAREAGVSPSTVSRILNASAKVSDDQRVAVEGTIARSGAMLAINQLFEARATFSAVFAANDQMAYGARLALCRRNLRVPDDISLIGLRQPVYDIGRLAAQAMLRLIAGEAAAIPPLPLELVVRESTRRLRR